MTKIWFRLNNLNNKTNIQLHWDFRDRMHQIDIYDTMKFIFYFIHGANCKFSTSVDETTASVYNKYNARRPVSTIYLYMSGDTRLIKLKTMKVL